MEERVEEMEKAIMDILIRDNEKYFQILYDKLLESPRHPKTDDEKERFSEELVLVKKTFKAKAIFFCYLLVEEAKKHNEPYIVNGTLGDLYILYVLGITRFNPIGTDCCYQACLGTLNNQNNGRFVLEMSFANQFVEHMQQFAISLADSPNKYHFLKI